MKKLIARIRKILCPHCGAEFIIPDRKDGKDYCPKCGSELVVQCDAGRPGA